MLNYRNNSYNSGDSIIATINDDIIFGKLYIRDDGICYLCHNSMDYRGDVSQNLQGYEYSWRFNSIDTNYLTDGVDIISYCTNIIKKVDYTIDNKLQDFLKSQNLGHPTILLELEDIFSGYNFIEISNTKGMIKLNNTVTKRFVEMKIGRFVNSLLKQVKEIHNYNSSFNNREIENISNNFISFQNDDYIKIETLSGQAILEGYRTDNHIDRKSTLGGSCMNNKESFLNLYVENPESVSMIVIKTFGRIVGRCLLWNTTCGQKLMDKRYTYADWVNSKFDEIRESNNYLNFDEQTKLTVKVNKGTRTNTDEYPYIDTFRMFNTEDDTLSNLISGNDNRQDFIVLSKTDGGYSRY